jgi:predicted adenylyl cyclase CyaB
MATEVEIRALIADAVAFRSALAENGFSLLANYDQRDVILDLPDGSLFKAGRKIRLRVEGERAELTYKGPPTGDKTASRRSEIDISVTPAQVEDYIELFRVIGFPVLYQIKKRREIFTRDHIKITLDAWPVLGYLAEIEGPELIIKECAQRIFPTIDFRNFRLKELFAQVCKQRDEPLGVLIAEYEKKHQVRVGDLASAIS